jgi:hypothetical protein
MAETSGDQISQQVLPECSVTAVRRPSQWQRVDIHRRAVAGSVISTVLGFIDYAPNISIGSV